MSCKEISENIYSLADNELSTFNKKKVLKHIEGCEECREEYTQVIKIKSLISSELTMNDFDDLDIEFTSFNNYSNASEINIQNRIKKSSSHWRYLFMKKKLIVASITLLLVIGAIVPVNGQNIIHKVSDWVKSLSFSSEETQYEVITDLNPIAYFPEYLKKIDLLREKMYKLLAEAKTPAEKNIIEAKYKREIEEIEKEEKERVAKYCTAYDEISELQKNFEYDFRIPSYIPEKYRLSNGEHYSFSKGSCNIISLKYAKAGINNGSPSLWINYEFIKEEIPERQLHYFEGTLVKATKVKDYDAVLNITGQSKGNNTDEVFNDVVDVGINVVVDVGDFKMVRIIMLVKESEVSNGVPSYIESELIKIAESILD